MRKKLNYLVLIIGILFLSSCEKDNASQFIGTYSYSNDGSYGPTCGTAYYPASLGFTVDITKEDNNTIRISSLEYVGFPVKCKVNESGDILNLTTNGPYAGSMGWIWNFQSFYGEKNGNQIDIYCVFDTSNCGGSGSFHIILLKQ